MFLVVMTAGAKVSRMVTVFKHLFKLGYFRFIFIAVILSTVLCMWYLRPCPRAVFVEEKYSRDLYVTVSPDGQIGDQLFKYAALLGIANRTGRKPVFPRHNALQDMFQLRYIADLNTSCWYHKYEQLPATHDASLYHLPLTNVTLAGSSLHSWKYFTHIEDTIMRELKFRDDVKIITDRYIYKYTTYMSREPRQLVGVHVHRGARVEDDSIPTRDYYERAMFYLKNTLDDVVFLVISDDIPWAKANLQGPDVVVVPNLSLSISLPLLLRCEHMIMSTGTLSWWAGWFALGHVVYYKGYPKSGSRLDNVMRKKDYFLPYWVGM